MMFFVLYALFFVGLCVVGSRYSCRPKGSVYLHIAGITIPLIVRTAPPVLTLAQKRKRGICCDRYKKDKSRNLHSPACRKRTSSLGPSA